MYQDMITGNSTIKYEVFRGAAMFAFDNECHHRYILTCLLVEFMIGVGSVNHVL